ncbi:MAG: hypothetical protein ACLQNE_10485 [Thermoguttaceae bacterium]
MRVSADMFLSVLVLAGMVNNRATAANGLPPCPPSPPCPPGATAAPPTTSGEAGVSGAPSTPSGGNAANGYPSEQPSATPDLSAIAGEQKEEPSLVSIAGAGLTSAAAGGAGTGAPANALILPGLLTAANAESPLPQNRIFFDYAFYDQFQIVNPNGSNALQPGFNLNRFDVGLEKTLFGGDVSVYVRAPFLYASDNVSSAAIDGVGDISAGFKVLLDREESGSLLSAGMTIAAPTAPAGQFLPNGNSGVWGTPTPVSVNPVFLQPWVAGRLNGDRFFVEDYFGVLVPTTSEVVTSINNSLSVGYHMWSSGSSCPECDSGCGERLLRSITPMLNAQVLVPLGSGGNNTTTVFPISFPTQLFLTEGCQFSLGERVTIFSGVVEPVVGPKAFSIGATFGASLAF